MTTGGGTTSGPTDDLLGALPQAAYAAAIAGLPGMGPAGLVDLLRGGDPEAVWRQLAAGEVRRPDPPPGRRVTSRRISWVDATARVDVGDRWRHIRGAGIGVTFLGQPDYPSALGADPEPAGVLFWIGGLEALTRPCVAVIGTRQCTSYGRTVAAQLGRDLASAGVCVVSGMALGIDGAAHIGALEAGPDGAGPVGVGASGVDLPYPPRHAALWAQVAQRGAVISETPPGHPAQTWRFPARNRLVAGVSQAVVVVESHAGGGSMLTVGAAADRGVDVLAVPGPVNSPASVGTNQLLHEGSAPARHAGDVLAALGDFRPWPDQPHSRERSLAPAGLDGPTRRILAAVDCTPTSTSVIIERTGVPLGPLSTVLLRLESMALIRGEGTWWERRGR